MLTFLRELMRGGHRGQVLVAAVGVMILGLGAIMISVDAGWWLRDKRDAQNDADAIALAAVQEIGDPSQRIAAELTGEAWAVANGIDPSTEMVPPDCTDGDLQGNFCFIDRNSDGSDDMVRVKVSRDSNSFIAEALGVGSPTLNPQAAAAKVRAHGACVLPWAIDAVIEDPEAYNEVWGVLGDPPDPEQLFVFQISSSGEFAGEDGAPGNFGALGVYGANTADYRDTIENECGSQGENACNSDSQVVTPDNPTLDCDIQTGNLGTNTDKALSDRADRYDEVEPYTDCDASSYDEALGNADSCPGRLVVLAIIKDFPSSGFESVDVYGIANFYIAGWDRCPPLHDGDCYGDPPVTETGIAWGFLLLEELGGTPAWKFDFSQSSNNPFAPVIVALVE